MVSDSSETSQSKASRLLKSIYDRTRDRNEPIFVTELAAEVGLTEDEVQAGWRYLKDTGRIDTFNIPFTARINGKRINEIESVQRHQDQKEEEWISATSALALLGMSHPLGARTICKRAHAGLIKARAARFIRDGRSTDNVDLPAEFWWAQGEAALGQNWTTGDFDTWIDHRIHLQAFGVTFRRSDIDPAKPTPVVENVAPIPSQAELPKFSDALTLKPGLWEMSIDLLKAWQWLQQRCHKRLPY
jgi:hypothetical protein